MELDRQIIPAFSRGGAACVDVMYGSVERFWSGVGGLQQRWKFLGQLLYLGRESSDGGGSLRAPWCLVLQKKKYLSWRRCGPRQRAEGAVLM